MVPARSDPRRPLLMSLLLLAAALAGCAGGDDAADPDAGADGSSGDDGSGGGFDDGEGTGGSDGASDDTPEQRAADRMSAALENLGGSEGPETYLMEMESHSVAFGSTRQTLLVDAPGGVTFFHFRDAEGKENVLVGQAGRTYFLGDVNSSLRAVRDEQAPRVTTQEEFATRYYSGEAPIGGLTPYFSAHQALLTAGFIPGYAADEVRTSELAGRPVTRMTFGESVVLMDEGMERLLSVRLVEDDYQGKRYANVTFLYGDEAVHPWSDALRRAETLAPYDPDAYADVQLGRDGQKNVTVTIRPATEGAIAVPVADVEARIYGVRDDVGEDDPLLVVPLREGAGATAELELEFEDADGDGAVSAGDALTYRALRQGQDAGDYRVFLVDASTGFHVLAS